LNFPFPVITCDIGGTNVRAALFDRPGAPARELPACKTEDFAGLSEALDVVLADVAVRPASAMVCAAGPVQGRQVKLTNAAWTVDGPEVARRCGLAQGMLFNDFEAQALSLPVLRDEWTHAIGAVPATPGTRLIHGPGTGLGTAALLEIGGQWCPVASEAAHSDFAPVSDEERSFWPLVEPVHGRITPEALISGPGLRRLHRARLAAQGKARPDEDGVAIVDAALADPAGEEARTVRQFWRLVARFSGDMALAFLAKGGVTLAGGILPRILPLLDEAEFRTVFENKAPYHDLAARIPVRVITGKDTVLPGLGAIAAQPERYLLDYAARAWVTPR
jgi:glucokinase